jgi:hypothetical protein
MLTGCYYVFRYRRETFGPALVPVFFKILLHGIHPIRCHARNRSSSPGQNILQLWFSILYLSRWEVSPRLAFVFGLSGVPHRSSPDRRRDALLNRHIWTHSLASVISTSSRLGFSWPTALGLVNRLVQPSCVPLLFWARWPPLCLLVTTLRMMLVLRSWQLRPRQWLPFVKLTPWLPILSLLVFRHLLLIVQTSQPSFRVHAVVWSRQRL